jgi:hypothetical protein
MSVTVSQLLTEIEQRELILPEFQRGYVWKTDQVSAYIRSLYRKYPTGHFLIWKTYKPPKFRGDKIQTEGVAFRLLLDGQQRLTSLYAIFKGVPPPFYEREKLFFNLYFNILEEEFQFWQPVKMRDNPAWIPVTEFLQKGLNTFLDELETLPDDRRELYQRNLSKFNKLDSIRNYSYELETIPAGGQEMTVQEVVVIFNLVNSQGTPLSKADLALAHICSYWPEARDAFNKATREMKSAGFDFKLDFLVRCVAGVSVGNILLEGTFYKSPIETIKEAWQNTKKVLEYLLNVLRNDAYIDFSRNLTTPYVILPLVVYLAKKGGVFQSQTEKKRFLRWMYAAQMWGRYSGSMESNLQADLNVLDSDDSADALIQNILAVSGRITVEPKDLVQKGVSSTFYKMAYIVARGRGAADWFTGLTLYGKNIGKPYRIEDHHIFPQSLLYKSGNYDSSNREHVRIVNELANRAFLTSKANLRASDALPEKYLPKVVSSFPDALRDQFVPEEPSLWQLDRYEDFLAERRKQIATAINDFMDSLLEEGKAEPVEDIHTLISRGESETIEFKSSARWDYRQQEKNKALEGVVVKTFAGFLNASGGKLLVGIDDDGNPLGLERDYQTLKKKDRDGYETFIMQLVSTHLGKELCPYVHVTFHDIGGQDVCLISVGASPKPVYVEEGNEARFYLRIGNSTQQLNTREAIEYITTHWTKD